MRNEETEGSSLFGGQHVPEKKWAEEEDAWNPSPLETDRSRWLVSEALPELRTQPLSKPQPVPETVDMGLRIQAGAG